MKKGEEGYEAYLEYQRKYREAKRTMKNKGIVLPKVRKKEKIGNWKIENNKKSDVSILTTYFKFRFYNKESKTYDENKYLPLQIKIKKALAEFSTIIIIEKGQLQVFLKGIENRRKAIDILDTVIQGFEAIYGAEYENVRSRNYKPRKKCAENL